MTNEDARCMSNELVRPVDYRGGDAAIDFCSCRQQFR
jgi:hypothetical protein